MPKRPAARVPSWADALKSTYPRVPLQEDEVWVASIQMNPLPIDPRRPAPGIRRNLVHMLDLCDAACAYPIRRPRLLVFPEFTLNGFSNLWTKQDWMRIALNVPGPETDLIARKAKELNAYIVFASHTQDRDWPGHHFNSSILVGPDGLKHVHWKAYGGFPGTLEFGATVHDVLDEFVERYGWDAVWPVARTPIGNIATYVCSEGMVPETARMFALQGAEIICRCIGGGGWGEQPGDQFITQFRADCAFSQVYGIYSNGGSGATINGKPSFECHRGGNSMVVDPGGAIISQAVDSREQPVTAAIPIALFRQKHRIPRIRTEIYAPMYERYPGYIPPNLYSTYVPKDIDDALRYSLKNLR
jgi:predicted amidohydrolase